MINRDRIIKVLKTCIPDGEGGHTVKYSDLGGVLGQVSVGGSQEEAEQYGVTIEEIIHFVSDLPLDTINYEDIPSGVSGYTFIPSVSEEGVISWVNNGGLKNPEPRDITGPAGPQGEAGAQGVDGEPGFSPIITVDDSSDEYYTITIQDATHTEDVNIKKEGAQGPQGPKGDKGDPGEKGETGETGATGPQGPQGIKGDKGDPGNNGTDGFSPIITETPTAAGYDITITDRTHTNTISLVNGAKGDKGDKGDQGIQGIQGETGAQGPKGDKGDTGETGPKGDKGDTGETGAQGPKGDTGETGPQGIQGIQGPAGNDGSDGADGYSPIATVTKSNGVATITITDKNGTTTETVSDGAQGPQGIQGPAGADGADGDDYIITSSDYAAIAAIVYQDYMTDATNVGY